MTRAGNDDLAMDAARAMDTFASGDSPALGLSATGIMASLITGMRHYADRHGIDFTSVLAAGDAAYASQAASERHHDIGQEVRVRASAVLTRHDSGLPATGPPGEPASTQRRRRRTARRTGQHRTTAGLESQMNDAQQERGQHRRLDALSGFQEAAEAAMSAWRQDLTTGQGMSAAWMLRNVISDFRIAAGLLSSSQGTGSPAVPDAPGERIALAAGCLDSAGGVLARAGHPAAGAAIAANLARGAGAGGDPSADGPAVAAAHAMHNAMSVPPGIWRQPADSAETRDEIVTQMMVAVDMLATATLTLASGAPAPFAASSPRPREISMPAAATCASP